MAKIVAHRYRGYTGNIFGRGISVASGNATFRSNIKKYINAEIG